MYTSYSISFFNVRVDEIYTFQEIINIITIYQILQSWDTEVCEGVQHPNFSQL